MPPGLAPEGGLLEFVEKVVHGCIALLVRRKPKQLFNENEDDYDHPEKQISGDEELISYSYYVSLYELFD